MKKGFTLLEILLTVSLLLIILSVAWIKFQPMFSIQENQEIRQLVRDLNFARNIAIHTHQSASIQIIDNTQYQLVYKDHVTQRKCKRIRLVNYPADDIKYLPTGAPALNYTIQVRGRTKNYRVTSTVATGKVQIVEN